MYENRAELLGRLAEQPVFGYESYGIRYYIAPLKVLRLSGAADRINLALPEFMLQQLPAVGQPVRVQGELRSFNNRTGPGNRLVITVLVRRLIAAREEEEHLNSIELGGVICKMPLLRRTPLGREICDMILAVNRRFGRSDYIPCIAWGQVARRVVSCEVGNAFQVRGRLQSRIYHKQTEEGTSERTAFELSIMELK